MENWNMIEGMSGGQVFQVIGLLWLASGIWEYFWYLGLYRTMPDTYVNAVFQQELKDSPIKSRISLLITSIILGPWYILRNIVLNPRPLVFSLS